MPRKKRGKGKATKFAAACVSSNLIAWCLKNGITLKGGMKAHVGDIVICSDGGEDFSKPDVVGRVLLRVPAGSRQPLVNRKGGAHPDGEYGHIFVLDYNKTRKPKKSDMPCK